MRNFIFIFITFFIIEGCGGGGSFSQETTKPIATYSAKEVKLYVGKNIKLNNKYTFGYKAYKISYKTTDDNGKSIRASGVIVVPILDGANKESAKRLKELKSDGLSIVLNCHGTIFSNSEAPSIKIASSKNPDAVGTLFSSLNGFVTLLPDYIGFGDSSSHYHPYLLKNSSASSIKDFINAAIKFANENDIELKPSRDVYLTGYSEGGYVAMSSIESIEKETISLKLVAPMAGPYFVEPIGDSIVKSNTIAEPAYVSNVVLSYAKVYNKSLQNILNKPYSSNIDELLSGKYTKDEINNQLTTSTKKLFKDEFLENYSTSWFRLRLLQNSAISLDYSPYVDIKMIHCKGDDVVPYKIATTTKEILEAKGANIELIDVEKLINKSNLNHNECIIPSYLIVADIFAKNRDKKE